MKKKSEKKWAVYKCGGEGNTPQLKVSPNLNSIAECDQYINENYPNCGEYEYGVFQVDENGGRC